MNLLQDDVAAQMGPRAAGELLGRDVPSFSRWIPGEFQQLRSCVDPDVQAAEDGRFQSGAAQAAQWHQPPLPCSLRPVTLHRHRSRRCSTGGKSSISLKRIPPNPSEKHWIFKNRLSILDAPPPPQRNSLTGSLLQHLEGSQSRKNWNSILPVFQDLLKDSQWVKSS